MPAWSSESTCSKSCQSRPVFARAPARGSSSLETPFAIKARQRFLSVGKPRLRVMQNLFVLGQLRAKRVISSCARDPRVLADLARLGYRAKHSGDKLARFLEAAVAQLNLPALASRNL